MREYTSRCRVVVIETKRTAISYHNALLHVREFRVEIDGELYFSEIKLFFWSRNWIDYVFFVNKFTFDISFIIVSTESNIEANKWLKYQSFNESPLRVTYRSLVTKIISVQKAVNDVRLISRYQ